MRVLAERFDDFSGKTDLHQSTIRKALKIAESNWVSGTRELDLEEQSSYEATFDVVLSREEHSSQSTTEVLRHGIQGKSEYNKAIYICLVPYKGEANKKRKIDGTPAPRTTVAQCPVVPVAPGDFLGVMSGRLRYTLEVDNPKKAVLSRHPKLWLDFSELTGKLNCMNRQKSNVSLTWKPYNGKHGFDWRIEVVATKEIWPFQELLRPTASC